MPQPAISPSCATPTKLVGVKAMNPAMLASDATRICAPARRPVCSSATGSAWKYTRAWRKRTTNWMEKSTAMPVNSTAKATETRLSVPTASAANPVVVSSPSSKVSTIGTTSRQLFTARNSSTRDQRQAADQPLHRALRDGGELLVLERDVAGQADMGAAVAHEFELGGVGAQHVGGGSAGLERREVEHRPGQARSDTCRRDRPPGRSAGAPRRAAPDGRRPPGTAPHGTRPAPAGSSPAPPGPPATPSAIRPSAFSRPRRLGSAASWPRKGWASIGLVQQRLQLRQVEEQQPVALQIGGRIGPGHGFEMRVVGSQRGRQRRGRRIRLLRRGAVDRRRPAGPAAAGRRG